MKKFFLFFVLIVGMSSSIRAQVYDIIYTYQGTTLFYNFTDSDSNQVQVVNPFGGDYSNYYNYVSGVVVIPDSIEYNNAKYSVIAIGDEAFHHCGVTWVIISEGITSIGYGAFTFCTDLTMITIPSSVSSIGDNAFNNCSGLTTVSIPDGVDSIGGGAFYYCPNLSTVNIGNDVEYIGSGAFYYCYNLTSVTIGSSVSTIDDLAFCGCSALSQVIIPSGVTNIGNGAFMNCASLSSIVIGSGVTNIGGYPFGGCSGIISIVVDEGNSNFDSRENCNAIIRTDHNLLVQGCNTTVIPSTVTAIGDLAFSGCNNLSLTTIPDGVISIGNSAFFGCSGLPSITIPASVTSIGSRAFFGCSGLISVNIPNSVTSIDYEAFSGCSGLNSVICQAATPPTLVYHDVFVNTNNCPIYVPCSSIGDYQSATYWSNYSSRICGMPNFDHNYEFLPNNETMGTVNVGAIDCDSNITVTAIPNTGYHFVEWSDGGTENPRTFHLTSDTNVTAIFSDSVTLCQLTVTSNDATMGSVTGSGSYLYGTEVTITATPAPGYRFDHWSDNSTQANYTFTLTDNLQLVAFFMPDGNGSDTVYVPIYIHDTITVTDTLWQTQYVHDTTVVTIHDSVVVNHYYHDTTFVHDYIHDTVMSYINHYVHDTTFVNNYIHDTVWMSSHVFDTTIVNIYQFDTTMVNLNIFDTTIVNNYIFDTVFISNYYYDTVHVHDTVYITQEGINGVDALNAKVYSSQGQIVVEGANGNMVTLYDVTGRTLISKQDEYTPLHFDAPASGTYLIKIGNHPARKVVVIR